MSTRRHRGVRHDWRPAVQPDPVGLSLSEAANSWLANGERGSSSEAIFEHMTGVWVGGRRRNFTNPSDPDDFWRCRLLLDAVPEFKTHLHRMSEVSSAWAALVARWADLESLMDSDLKLTPGVAPTCYATMVDVLDEAQDPSKPWPATPPPTPLPGDEP